VTSRERDRPVTGEPLLRAFLSASALLLTRTASACPNCALGRQARADVWSYDFTWNLAVALLPFLVVGAICSRLETSDRLELNDAKQKELGS
jgi:hypothetical protein